MNGPSPQTPDLTHRVQTLVSALQRGALDRAERTKLVESLRTELSSVSTELHDRAAGDPLLGALLALLTALLPDDDGAGEGGDFIDAED